MAKGQQRKTKEAKKPKKETPPSKVASLVGEEMIPVIATK